MSRFFVPRFEGNTTQIDGADAHHILRVLRMRVGEELWLCDGEGCDYRCRVTALREATVEVEVTERLPNRSEPTVAVTLYQGLPKSEKMEWILQKAVELGVARVVPVAMARSVVRLTEADGRKKRERWQKIAAGAAEQSGRGRIPTVAEPIPFSAVLRETAAVPCLVFYEGGGSPLADLVSPQTEELAIVIGPEGGFEPSEVEALRENGAQVATLGPRILRCETAPLAALSVIMQLTGNLN